MSETETRQEPADDRQPLVPGSRIGNAYLILKTSTRGQAALSYEALRLADQNNVSLHEFFPRGLAARTEDGRVAPVRGWEEEFAVARARFTERATRLAKLDAPALMLPIGEIEDLGTLYIVTHSSDAPTLSGWAGDLMRRPADVDIARLARRLAGALQTLHAVGLAHGVIEDRYLQVTEPAEVTLGGLLAGTSDAASAAQRDVRGLAAALYGVVTGRQPPPEMRDRSLDARFATRHMVTGDYDDTILGAIDAALEFGEEATPVNPAEWLALLSMRAAALLGEDAGAVKPAPVPERAPNAAAVATAKSAKRPAASARAPQIQETEGQAPKLQAPKIQAPKIQAPKLQAPKIPAPKVKEPPAAKPARADQPPAHRSLRFVAVAGLVLVGVAGWLGYLLIGKSPPSPSAPQVAVQTEAPKPAPVAPAAIAPARPEAVAPPPVAPPTPVVVVPAPTPSPAAPSPLPAKPDPEEPDPAPEIRLTLPEPPPIPGPPSRPAVSPEAIASATTREALLDLIEKGGDRAAITSRIAALGYVPVNAGGETLFRKPGEGEVWRDCSLCPELVLVPSGSTGMQVTIADVTRQLTFRFDKPLAVARFEVTRGQFGAFVRETGRTGLAGCHARKPEWGLNPSLSWENPGIAQQDDHPVVCVSFQDATAYAEWLSARSGQRYRLPSDAEWHHLAVAEGWRLDDAEFYCRVGNGADLTAREANPDWQAATCKDGFAETAPVGRFGAGPWGVHDLNGNVWEWVSTCAPDPTPDAAFPPRNCQPGAPRLLRGGSWADAPRLRQLDSRVISAPTIRDQVAGFRLVREP